MMLAQSTIRYRLKGKVEELATSPSNEEIKYGLKDISTPMIRVENPVYKRFSKSTCACDCEACKEILKDEIPIKEITMDIRWRRRAYDIGTAA